MLEKDNKYNKYNYNSTYDCLIIGAGVTGSAIARELSRYNLAIAIVEKSEDVCTGTSKANSAIIHGGFDARTGTKKAEMNVLGNAMMDQVSEELGVPFRRNGALVLCWDKADIPALEKLQKRGETNGVKNLKIITRDEGHRPTLPGDAVAALYCPSSGIICPFELNLAFAENAVENGADFEKDCEVLAISRVDDLFIVKTSKGDFRARTVVNAAGVFADKIRDMYLEHQYTITPRKGEYCLFDKSVGTLVDQTVFQLPTEKGKGVLVTPTIHGNLMVGPTSFDIDEPEDKSTSAGGLAEVLEKGEKSVGRLPKGDIITSFAGLRAHGDTGDFVLDMTAEGFFEAACIESPGLSASPAIGRYMSDMVAGYLKAEKNENFKPRRVKQQKASQEQYHNIICRCEQISEGEIVDAIHSTIGATTLDGVKRRVRAGAGRCQGGFCSIKVMEILARELDIPFEDVSKNSKESKIVLRKSK